LKKKQLWISFIIFIVLCFIVQIIGSFWTRETVSTWYPTLIKPSWTPPNSIFGPVWSCLYVVIALAGWLIYRTESSSQRSLALIFYGVQLSLNFIWSFLFFSLRNPMLGLIDILLLSLFIILTIVKSYSFRPLASLLLIPYLLWVLYATALNAAIYILNK